MVYLQLSIKCTLLRDDDTLRISNLFYEHHGSSYNKNYQNRALLILKIKSTLNNMFVLQHATCSLLAFQRDPEAHDALLDKEKQMNVPNSKICCCLVFLEDQYHNNWIVQTQ